MIKFSIIIPVYNVEDYLEHCINSILHQSFKDYEIILVNDGSTDKSGVICDKYANEYENIRVIHKKNEGQSQARNVAIKDAKGEYIVFVDSDDWLIDRALENANKIIKEYNNPDIIINRIKSYYEETDSYVECEYRFDTNTMANKPSYEVLKMCYEMPTFWSAPWVFVINKEYLKKNEFYFPKGLLHEDEYWAPIILLNAKQIGFNNNCFYCNRANRVGSTTQSVNIKKEYDKFKIIDMLIVESQKETYMENEKDMLLSRCSSIYLGILKNISLYRDSDRYKYKELILMLKKNRKILLYSKRKSHTIAYLCTYILGIELTSKIILSRR